MAARIDGFLDRLMLRKVQERLARVANDAESMDHGPLRIWRGRARAMRREIDRVLRQADRRLGLPLTGTGLPHQPLGTDWAWRPDIWAGPVPVAGQLAHAPRTMISNDVALFHDCRMPEVIVRQHRNAAERDLSPFGVSIDAFTFDGTFLSLAIDLPEAAVAGLQMRHLIRVAMVVDVERRTEIFARLNIQNGPNVEQLVREMPGEGRDRMVQFDLHYSRIDEKRVSKIWLDLIFSRPAMNRISLRDVTVSRRPRAEL